MSDLVRVAPWSFSVSELQRAISGFDGNRFMRRQRSSVLRRYGNELLNSDDFVLAIDDTDNPRYGKGVFRVGNWHGSKGTYLGQRVQVLVLVDIVRGFAIPLSYRFGKKKDDPGYLSGIDLAFEQIQEVVTAGFPVRVVVADSWFSSVDLMKKVVAIGLHYCIEIKSNRRVKSNPGPNVAWQTLSEIFAGIRRIRLRTRLDSSKIRNRQRKPKTGACTRIMIKEFKSFLTGLAVYNKRNSKEAFAYYVSTDLTMSGARLWEISRSRWKIEVMFRDLKQNLSFGRLPCQGEKAADLAVCVPFMIYTSLRLDPPENWGLKGRATIGIMLKQIREHEFERSLQLILNNPKHGKVLKLRARRSRFNQKPVDAPSTAEKSKPEQSEAA